MWEQKPILVQKIQHCGDLNLSRFFNYEGDKNFTRTLLRTLTAANLPVVGVERVPPAPASGSLSNLILLESLGCSPSRTKLSILFFIFLICLFLILPLCANH